MNFIMNIPLAKKRKLESMTLSPTSVKKQVEKSKIIHITKRLLKHTHTLKNRHFPNLIKSYSKHPEKLKSIKTKSRIIKKEIFIKNTFSTYLNTIK